MVSERLTKDISDCVIRKTVYGSDHCPLVLGLAIGAASDSNPDSKEDKAAASDGVDPVDT